MRTSFKSNAPPPPGVLHELVSSGVLAGTLHGHLEKAVYVPHVYTRMQNRWADSFLESNGYLGKANDCYMMMDLLFRLIS